MPPQRMVACNLSRIWAEAVRGWVLSYKSDYRCVAAAGSMTSATTSSCSSAKNPDLSPGLPRPLLDPYSPIFRR
jgi:hypothetical protein